MQRVTRTLLVGVGAASVASALLQRVPHVEAGVGVWRMAAHGLVCTSGTQAVLGAVLAYTMRPVEMIMGGPKYAAMLAVCLACSSVVEWVALWLLRIRRIPAGPYALLAAMFFHYALFVPPIYRSSVLPFITLTDKLFTCALVAHFLLIAPPNACVAACAGIFSAYCYHANIAQIADWRFPKYIQTFVSRFFASSSSSSSSPAQIHDASLPSTATSTAPSATALPTPTINRQEAIDNIVAMGFDHGAAVDALESTNYDLNAALNLLLSQ